VDLPEIFTSQGQAAAMLKTDVYVIRAAKAAGCPAFVGSGRIRAKELQAWLENRAARDRKEDKSESKPGAFPDRIELPTNWDVRGQFMVLLVGFVHMAFYQGRLTLEEYLRVAQKTFQWAAELARSWGVWDENDVGWNLHCFWEEICAVQRTYLKISETTGGQVDLETVNQAVQRELEAVMKQFAKGRTKPSVLAPLKK
jgi:hypothetical protein